MDRILVIHTDSKMRAKLASSLQQAGFEITTANDGNQGIDKIYKTYPDLIIIAEGLPLINGDKACFRIRQISSSPIIVLGIGQEEVDGIEMLESGADVYLPSPLDLRELLARVRSLLRRKRGSSDCSFEEH